MITAAEILSVMPRNDPRRKLLAKFSDTSDVPSKRRSKYGAVATVVDNIRFDSKREALAFGKCGQLQKAGLIQWFIRQPIFDLGGGVVYRADFLLMGANGVRVIDVKGVRTKEYRIKKRLVESRYPIKVEEW